MEKSPEAFRTISEVADWLGVPTHVLRFWESRFSQVKPVKRAGGRRYYRPNDMLLLGGIKCLLHDEGMTIRGVQKLLREEGVKHVSGFSQALDAEADMRDVTPATEVEDDTPSPMAVDVEPEEVDNVVPMSPAQSEAPEEPSEEIAASAEPEAQEPETGEPEEVPQFTFLHRPTGVTAATAQTPDGEDAGAEEPEESAAQSDLFTSRRSAPPPAAAAPEPVAPRIPETPDVPETDPEDDDRAFPARTGLAAHLRGLPRSRLRVDPALVARAVSDLRAIRERL